MFKIDSYHTPFRRDRDCHSGGLMTFIRSDIPSVRRKELDSRSTEMKLQSYRCTGLKSKYQCIFIRTDRPIRYYNKQI